MSISSRVSLFLAAAALWACDPAPPADALAAAAAAEQGRSLPLTTAGSGAALRPKVATDGVNYLVVWAEYGGSGARILGARVSKFGFLMDASSIVVSSGTQDDAPAVAFDGTNYLVTWTEGGSSRIRGARVAPSGAVLDPAAITIASGAGARNGQAMAFDGSNYLVTWTDTRGGSSDIYAARVAPSGAVLDPAGIAVSGALRDQDSPAVAFDGSNYLVVWSDGRNGAAGANIYGAQVAKSGAVLTPGGLRLSSAPGFQFLPSVACDGAACMVVWKDMLSSRPSGSDIVGARVSKAGAVMDPAGIAISSDPSYQDTPAVAYDGINYVITWVDPRNGASGTDIYGARVHSSGGLIDPTGFVVKTAAGSQTCPALVFNYPNYLVVWQDAGASPGTFKILGTRMSRSAMVFEPGGIPIS